jgi:hypothetical protein
MCARYNAILPGLCQDKRLKARSVIRRSETNAPGKSIKRPRLISWIPSLSQFGLFLQEDYS